MLIAVCQTEIVDLWKIYYAKRFDQYDIHFCNTHTKDSSCNINTFHSTLPLSIHTPAKCRHIEKDMHTHSAAHTKRRRRRVLCCRHKDDNSEHKPTNEKIVGRLSFVHSHNTATFYDALTSENTFLSLAHHRR